MLIEILYFQKMKVVENSVQFHSVVRVGIASILHRRQDSLKVLAELMDVDNGEAYQ